MPRLRIFLFLLSFLLCAPAVADGIRVKSAEITAGEDSYNLKANFDIRLSPTLEEALKRGVALNFLTELELTRLRWYWIDEKILETSWHTRLSYNQLTRQYRLNYGALYQNFDNLSDSLQLLGSVINRQTVAKSLLKKGGTYVAKIRMSLDQSLLPKPFQVDAIASTEWDLGSDWFHLDFVP